MSNTNIVTVDGFEFQYRDDEYINLTKMCKQTGKKINHYFRTQSTQAFLGQLALRLNKDVKTLVFSKLGGIPTEQGTWGHPLVALHLAQWLSPEIYVDIALKLSHLIDNDLLYNFISTPLAKDTSAFIYLVNIKDSNLYKIGYSTNVIKRLSSLQTANALELMITERYFSLNARSLESKLHEYYQENNIRGEWYQLSTTQVKEFIYVVNQLDKEQEDLITDESIIIDSAQSFNLLVGQDN